MGSLDEAIMGKPNTRTSKQSGARLEVLLVGHSASNIYPLHKMDKTRTFFVLVLDVSPMGYHILREVPQFYRLPCP